MNSKSLLGRHWFFANQNLSLLKDLKDIIIQVETKRTSQNTEYYEFICIDNKDAKRVSVSSLLGYIAYKMYSLY